MPRLTLLPLAGHPSNPLGAPPEERALVVEVEPGVSVLDAASVAGFLIATRCGGIADCQTCRVEPLEGAQLSSTDELELSALREAGARAGERLACQARVLGDATVFVPNPALLEDL